MTFWDLPYPSRRAPVLAEDVVATSQPLAAQAGLTMFERGGNAVDAALAAAITLAVVEPTSNGVGGDAFAIVWSDGRLHGLNGSGRSPAAWTPERFAGAERMPQIGWESVTVPGAPDAWRRLSERFGNRPFADCFEPALRYAADGFAVSPITSAAWARAAERYAAAEDVYAGFAAAFLPGGRAPAPGERVRLPELGHSLKRIARSNAEELYTGELGAQLVADARVHGGALTERDLATHRSEWVTPLSVPFREMSVHELPPNGQGLAALVALGILDRLGVEDGGPDCADSIHLQIEAMKSGFAEAHRHVADPAAMTLAPEALFTTDVLAQRAAAIERDRARTPVATPAGDRGTVYVATADRNGMMVSMIQSNYEGFGSGVVVPGTGISLQNRGAGFSLESGHPNEVSGGKRPYHTIIPGFVTRGANAVMAFGVMGGHMQPQGHVQMCTRIFAHSQNPQAASDAPRWCVREDGRVALEAGADADLARALEAKGHVVTAGRDPGEFGGAQLVMRLGEGYLAASDHRKDGGAAGR